MPLTQTQFDEAMKPGRVDMHSSAVEDHMKSVSEIGRSTSPIIMKETPFSSATSPIKSLLAGEKIQFGVFANSLRLCFTSTFVSLTVLGIMLFTRCCYIPSSSPS